MTVSHAMGISAAPASHVFGRKFDRIPFSAYHVVLIVVLGFVCFIESVGLALSGSLLRAEFSAARGHDRHCTKIRSLTITIFRRASP